MIQSADIQRRNSTEPTWHSHLLSFKSLNAGNGKAGRDYTSTSTIGDDYMMVYKRRSKTKIFRFFLTQGGTKSQIYHSSM